MSTTPSISFAMDLCTCFYQSNNHGKADVTIEKLSRQPNP